MCTTTVKADLRAIIKIEDQHQIGLLQGSAFIPLLCTVVMDAIAGTTSSFPFPDFGSTHQVSFSAFSGLVLSLSVPLFPFCLLSCYICPPNPLLLRHGDDCCAEVFRAPF